GMSVADNYFWNQPYKFGGKELDRMNGLDLYDFGARMLDSAAPTWSTPDPLAQLDYSISPYVYCNANPINAIDPDGMSTWVIANSDGTYRVVGGILDDDKNIYSVSFNDGTMSTKTIGETSSVTSFYNSDANNGEGAWAIGSTINPNDNSGQNFLSGIVGDTPSLGDYILNARNNKKYDFKVTNGTIKNSDIYRGMPIGKTNGKTIYSSARDIGNMAAGFVAGVHGFSWMESRIAFDSYQSYSSGRFTSEGISTQNAEYYGWREGSKAPIFIKNLI
ncbi:MAG: RHS repeat-associated core domain-containing protein, partial [Muribaculaceae bacterium]